MGILVYREPTFYHHRHLLIPTIVMSWRKYQKKVLDALKGKDVVLAGDGHHDSMGQSAKFASYYISSCTVGLIVHIVLVQASLVDIYNIFPSVCLSIAKERSVWIYPKIDQVK